MVTVAIVLLLHRTVRKHAFDAPESMSRRTRSPDCPKRALSGARDTNPEEKESSHGTWHI